MGCVPAYGGNGNSRNVVFTATSALGKSAI